MSGRTAGGLERWRDAAAGHVDRDTTGGLAWLAAIFVLVTVCGYIPAVASLDSATRAGLPDNAFAYVDTGGRRRLPIHDEAHVRNALARFNQVKFEDERARQRALKRLLNAAKKHGIVPVGFITSQLQSAEPAQLPSGFVTMLMTDIEDSTALVHRLGDRYGRLLDGVRAVLADAVKVAGGCVDRKSTRLNSSH